MDPTGAAALDLWDGSKEAVAELPNERVMISFLFAGSLLVASDPAGRLGKR